LPDKGAKPIQDTMPEGKPVEGVMHVRRNTTIARNGTNKARRRPQDPLNGGQVDLGKTSVERGTIV